MESEGYHFVELFEKIKIKQNSLKESIVTQEEEKKVLSEQIKQITEQLQLKYRAAKCCDEVVKDAETKYVQFSNIYTKSQKLLANLENDIDAVPNVSSGVILNELNSSSCMNNPSQHFKRSRTTNDGSNTLNTVTDDTDSTTQASLTNGNDSAIHTVDQNQYEVVCILGKVLPISTILLY